MSLSFLKPSEFLSMPVFGLDISKSSIKIIKLKRYAEGVIPDVVDEVEVSESCELFTSEGSIIECKEVTDKLAALKKKHKINFARISIPEEKTYVFKVLVPKDALYTVAEFIMYNLDQYVPLDPQEVIFDYKILEHEVEEGKTPVIVTVIPKVIINQYTQLAESAGITVVACEPETHAIARAVINRHDLNPYIIINVDMHTTNISIVENNFVQYTQTLPLSGDLITNTMTSEMSANFKDSINRVIIYWFTSRDRGVSNSKIENIILTGESLRSTNLVNYLETSLSVNATLGNVWKNCFDLNEYVPKLSKEDSLKYATCIGLCLLDIK